MRWLAILAFAAFVSCPRAGADPTIKLPPAALDRILFAQIGDTRIKDPAVLVGQRAFIWGASDSALGRGLYTSYYYPSNRDLDRSHTLGWYEKNKPDWVAYQCDRKTPAYDHTYSWGAYVPLDFTRADVREYVLDKFLAPAIARGFAAIAYDNVGITNSVHRCGVWRDGQWVQQFSGEAREPEFAAAVLDYLGWVKREVNARGAALSLNAHIDARRIDVSLKLLSLADIWLDEGGFSNDCRRRVVDDIWRAKFQLAVRKASESPYVSMNVLCGPLAKLDAAERAWIVANFLLVRGAQSYLALLGSGDGGKLLDYTGFDPDIGKPVGASRLEGEIYRRDYERGLVLVNPSSDRSAIFEIEGSGDTDSQGKLVPSTVTLAPRSGMVISKAAAHRALPR